MKLIKIFPHSFNGKDTKIYKDKHGQIFIENGCQKFHKDDMFEVCKEYFVDLSYIEEIADTIGLSLQEYATKNPNALYAKMYQLKYGTKEDLDLLVKDQDYLVRSAVAKSPNVTKKYLNILVKDKYWLVRYDVAQNPNVIKEHLDVLVKDEKWDVRYAVAQSPNVTKEHLDILVKDENEHVREAAKKISKFHKQTTCGSCS